MQTSDLFETPDDQEQAILLKNADLILYKKFFSQAQSDHYFTDLLKEIDWQQGRIRVYGKMYDEPRLSAWYGDSGTSYTYSGITRHANVWTDTLSEIKHSIEMVSGVSFNSVLINLYRDGQDSVGWHSDDEPELGKNPFIASVSLGESRVFQLRHKTQKDQKYALNLQSGSLLLMRGETQHFWQHQIPKSQKQLNQRINLTFRNIV